MPVLFLPHGGGPWPFVELGLDPAEVRDLAGWLRKVPDLAPAPPKALVVISAHWEERAPTVTTSAAPPMLYDYYGFPPQSYEIKWPAPGAPELAARVRALVEAAGFPSAEDASRGFDHGTFVPMKLAWPEAEIPTIQLSLVSGLDPDAHLRLGRALAPLRDEGVFLIGSGMSFHNLRTMRDPRAGPISEAFDAWLQATMTGPAEARDDHLRAWAQAPMARAAHPREEHLLPLMVIAGAAGLDPGSIPWSGRMIGWKLSAVAFGMQDT